MIHVQFFGRKVLSAILAHEFVTLQKILAIELHFLHEHPVIGTQNQNTGNKDSLTDGVNHAGAANGFKLFAMSKPRGPVEHSETSVFGKDNLSMIEGKQTEGPLDAHYVHRLPEAVQNECLKTSVHPT